MMPLSPFDPFAAFRVDNNDRGFWAIIAELIAGLFAMF
jgi:hypothetical protein